MPHTVLPCGISVIDVVPSEVVGNYVQKVGVTKGWTDGNILEIDQTVTGNDGHIRYGQTRASYVTQEGDSGGPVFWPYSSDAVAFEGVHWAWVQWRCGPDHFCEGAWYSPVSGILSDLGASPSQLNFTTDVTVSAPTLTGSLVSACGIYAPYLSWTASSVSGTTWPVQYTIWYQDYHGGGLLDDWKELATVGSGTTSYQSTDCPVQSYLGTSPPSDDSPYTAYQITAHVQGKGASSAIVYFQW